MRVDTSRSLEEIEGPQNDAPSFASALVQTALQLRKKPLQQLTPGDIRLLIGQGIGLTSLVPLAIDILESEPFVESAYYPGDLLCTVLSIQPSFWGNNLELSREVSRIIDSLGEPLARLVDSIDKFRAHSAGNPG